MAQCPCCKGVGSTPLKVTTLADGGRSEYTTSTTCWYCNGRKQVSIIDALHYPIMLKEQNDIWCQCKGYHGSTYHPDRGGMKHHWTCNRCKKITQIG